MHLTIDDESGEATITGDAAVILEILRAAKSRYFRLANKADRMEWAGKDIEYGQKALIFSHMIEDLLKKGEKEVKPTGIKRRGNSL